MAKQQDPAQQESERLAQGEDTTLPDGGTGEGAQDNQNETAGSGPAESTSTPSGDPDDPSEASRRGLPGYQ